MKNYLNFMLMAVIATILVSCGSNSPEQNKSFVGTWEPVLYEGFEIPDLFIITSDSIKAIRCKTQEEHYQCHYQILREGVIELERCWFKQYNANAVNEPDYIVESEMYFDKNGYLIINPFTSEITQRYPNYFNLKLRRHQ